MYRFGRDRSAGFNFLISLGLAIIICACSLLAGGHSEAADSVKKIVVSIGDQVAYFIEDGFLVKSHIVSTGTDYTPTPVGVFSIYKHQYEYHTGSVIQYYSMFFHGILAFHSILYSPSTGSWVGGDTLGQKASHGCIRQWLSDAHWAYEWAPDGTQVEIIQEHFTPPMRKPDSVQGGSNVLGIAEASNRWHFAEGSTALGFKEYLMLMNPNPYEATATVNFTTSDGTGQAITRVIGALSRQTIYVNEIVNGAQGVCATISTDRPVVAERCMYFVTGKQQKGGETGRGCAVPASDWYFAEGTCRPGFDSFICVQNPGDQEAKVRIEYMLGDGNKSSSEIVVPPRARCTVNPKEQLGEADDSAHDFSCKVRSTGGGGIVVERPVYFNYHGVHDGGHNTLGAKSPARAWYFAEGTCRPGFDPYICVMNPGKEYAKVKMDFILGNRKRFSDQTVVPPQTRYTLNVKDKLGEGNDSAHDFSCTVRSTGGGGIVVERPVYFNYHGASGGGHNTLGAKGPSREWYFAEGSCRPGFDPYLSLFNPTGKEATVELTYLMGDGRQVGKEMKLPPWARCTVNVKDQLGEGDDAAHDFSCMVKCSHGQGIVAERPMYFNYRY